MPLGTNHDTKTTADKFIPELWSDDTIAAYKSNLVLANLVTRMNHKGSKGDTIHIPNPGRGAASVKQAQSQVNLITDTAGSIDVVIDKHYEYSRLIEDIVSVQALDSMRAFYTDDAGYALARQVDFDLHVLGSALQGGTLDTSPGTIAAPAIDYAASTSVIGGDGSTDYNGTNESALTDAGIRKMIQTLDDQDVPQSDRALVVPPSERNNLMGIARFTEQSFTGEMAGGNTIRNGLIGDIYGIPVFVSTACPAAASSDKAGMLFHKSAFALVEQMGVRSQTQYKQEYLGDLLTVDTIYGVKTLRDDAGVSFVVPA